MIYASQSLAPEQLKQGMERFRPFLEKIPACWVAGGAVRSFFAGEKIQDVDCFFLSSEMATKAKDALLADQEIKAQVLYENDHVYKMSCKLGLIDLVRRPFLSPTQTLEGFDFTVCCAAVAWQSESVPSAERQLLLVYHDTFFIDLAKRRLVISADPLPFPLSTLQRLHRFAHRNFWACNGTMLTIAKAMARVQFDDPQQNTIQFYPDKTPRFVRYD